MSELLQTCWILVCVFTLTSGKCPEIVTRAQWGAAAPKRPFVVLPKNLDFVIIHHTTDPKLCTSYDACKTIVKNTQKFHQGTRKWNDIGYNFLIGNDGKVYEGRGWSAVGTHAPNFNSRSIGIAFIGNFNDAAVPNAMTDTAKQLIQCGIEGSYISARYQLFGHRQVKATECPGNKLYTAIQSWPHFSTNVPK